MLRESLQRYVVGERGMISDLKAYPAYKDSGVPWLDEVPEHWDVRRIRNVAEMRASNVDKHAKEGELPVRLCNYTDVYKNDRITERVSFMRASATSEEIERFRLMLGDVLVTKDSEVWNDIGIPSLVEYAAEDLICGYHLALLRSRKAHLNGDFLFRVLQSPVIAYHFHVAANGVTRYGLSQDAIKSVFLPIPHLSEQSSIVRFLNHMDRRIRRYIRAKQKLIKLLEEQKQAIIHRVVTRGLNPSVPLKPSGVEWLGDMPEHWDVVRNGRLFVQRNETGYSKLPILEVSLKTGIRVRNFEASDRKQVMTDREKYKRAAKGDIAYNMMRMWQGAVGIAPVDGLVSPAYVVAKPLKWTEPRYFSFLFHTGVYMGEVDKFSRGIVKDRNRLYWEDFKQMQSTCPPFDEQVMISNSIRERTATLDNVMQRIIREIWLLREYRAHLISDVVTGKLDVRGIDLPATADAEVPEESNDLLDSDSSIEDDKLQEELLAEDV